MFQHMKSKMKKNLRSRILILVIVFLILGGFLIQRLFVLQIIRGEDYENNFTMQIKKEKVLDGTRGNIYDVNGYPLAYNKLVYCVTFEDVGSYETIREKNLKLNGIFYQLIKIIEENGSEVISDFGIRINSSGNYEFAKTGFNLMRFKADVYGRVYIEDLTEEEENIDAASMMEELCSDDYYGERQSEVILRAVKSLGIPAQRTGRNDIVADGRKFSGNAFLKAKGCCCHHGK